MNQDTHGGSPSRSPTPHGRLDSWKEIANYLGREKRTVQRWEKTEGLPIHRHLHQSRHSVFAYKEELDQWLEGHPESKAKQIATSRLWNWRRIVALTILAVAAGTAFQLFLWRIVAHTFNPDRPARSLTNYQGQEIQPSVSPKGDLLSFSWTGNSGTNRDIYVQYVVGASRFRRTTDPRLDYSPAWSPDGSRIAFLRKTSEDIAELLTIPAILGNERSLAEVRAPPWEWGHQLSWSTDGRWLAVPTSSSDGDPFTLLAVNVTSGNAKPLTQPLRLLLGDHSPSVSPDGTRLAFVRSRGPGCSDLFLVGLDKDFNALGQPAQLTRFSDTIGRPAWSQCGKQILFTLGSQPQTRLMRIEADSSGSPRPSAVETRGISSPFMTIDHRLVFCKHESHVNIWAYKLDEARTSAPLINSSGSEGQPNFSSSRNALLFVSDLSGSPEIWEHSIPTGRLTQITALQNSRTGNPAWSPDGSWIAFESAVSGNSEIYVVSSNSYETSIRSSTESLTRLTSDPGQDLFPSWSRDGRWIYFTSDRSGSFQIWKRQAGGTEAVAVTTDGGYHCVESPDGSAIYYTRLQSPGIWKLDLLSGRSNLAVAQAADNFALSASGLFFLPPQNDSRQSSKIFRYAFSDGGITLLGDWEGRLLSFISVADDESTIYVSRFDESRADILVVDDFHCRRLGGICEKIIPW